MKRWHNGSIKSSILDHEIDITEDMYKISEVHGFIF